MTIFDFGQPSPYGYYDVAARDLKRLPSGVRYIDVREPSEFDGDLGHLAEAELVPMAAVPTAATSWDRTTPILLICRSGRRSADTATRLCAMGFQQVANLAGGMLAVRGRS